MNRHVVVGDIHGCFAELQQLLAAVGADDDDIIVSVGDLVDRGPESADVIRFFRERPERRIAIVGNHERKHIRGIFSYAQEITKLQLGAEYDDAVAWMRTLPYWLELDCAIVVHAALVPGRPLREQDPEVLCGSTSGEKKLAEIVRDGWWHEHYADSKPVIFGHHVVDEPLLGNGLVYGIDTGACHGGRLTAVTLPGYRLHSVPAREDHWKRIKRAFQADVLAAKPWEAMMWTELDEQLARFRDVDDPRARSFIEALTGWRAMLDQRVGEVVAGLQQEAARVQTETDAVERARTHPLSKFLFQAFRGRLDRAALLKQVHTPRALDDLAAALGLVPFPRPDPITHPVDS